jgi:hypothetical protein
LRFIEEDEFAESANLALSIAKNTVVVAVRLGSVHVIASLLHDVRPAD